jgi:hypothetical protein
LTRSIFFIKSKQRCFRKKNQWVATGFWWVNRVARSTRRVTPGFTFSYFFLNPAWFQHWIDPPDRVWKLCFGGFKFV